MWQQHGSQQTLMTWQEVFLGGVGGSLDVLDSPINELRPLRVPSEKKCDAIYECSLDKMFRGFDTCIASQPFSYSLVFGRSLNKLSGPQIDEN